MPFHAHNLSSVMTDILFSYFQFLNNLQLYASSQLMMVDPRKDYVLTIASAHFGIGKEKNESTTQKCAALDEFLNDGNSTVLVASKNNDKSLHFTTNVSRISLFLSRSNYD